MPSGRYQYQNLFFQFCSKSWFSGGDEDSNFSLFRVRRFTESPGPLHIHWIASPPFHWKALFWEKLSRGVSKQGGFPLSWGKVRLLSQTLSGLFLVGLLIGCKRGKGPIGRIPGPSPDKSGKSRKNRESPKKGQKKGRTSPDRETPPFETPPRLAALDFFFSLKSASSHTLPKNRLKYSPSCRDFLLRKPGPGIWQTAFRKHCLVFFPTTDQVWNEEPPFSRL